MSLKKFLNASKGKKPKAVKDPLVARIDKYLEIKHNPVLDYVPKPSHKPSSFGQACLRRIYYEYFKVEKETKNDAKTGKLFDAGNMFEDIVMSWLKGMNEHIPYLDPKTLHVPYNRWNSELNPQFPITVPDWKISKGFIDNVAIVDGELWLYEIKSQISFKYDNLTEPTEDHKIQVGPYYKAFNENLLMGNYAHIPELKDWQDEAVGVKFIYISRNTGEFKIYSMRQEALMEVIDSIHKKVELMDTYIDTKTLPPCNPESCKYCPFKKKCAADWNL